MRDTRNTFSSPSNAVSATSTPRVRTKIGAPSMHEYIAATEADPGAAEPQRDGYGWNSFLANLLESAGPL